MELIIISPDPEATLNIGRIVGHGAPIKSILALTGKLGAGKTLFIQGLAQGLKTHPAHPVTSPSYNLIHEYPGPTPLYHFDFYRMEKITEVLALGYEEYFEGEGVTAVEWAEKFPEIFSDNTLWITITRQDDDSRVIKMTGSEQWTWLGDKIKRLSDK